MRNYQLFIHILNDFPSRKKSKKERSEMFHYQLSKTSFLQLPSESITFPMHCYSKSTRLFRFISSIIIHMPNEFPSRKKQKRKSEAMMFSFFCNVFHLPSKFATAFPSTSFKIYKIIFI